MPEERRAVSVNFAKMQQIFLSAVERHRPENWETYLDQACAGDDELRNHVKLLLTTHVETGNARRRSPYAGPNQRLSGCGCWPGSRLSGKLQS